MTGSAHAASLPIFFKMQMVEGLPVWDRPVLIYESLQSMKLEKDIEVVIRVAEKTGISLEGLTPYGQQVLDELEARASFVPCPEGECEYTTSSACRWCGSVRSDS